ncbi:DUF4286 family protein [Labilibacter sediminis]|nr:DUF4286 family protein [Labilibacter sediminis]
MFIFNTTFVVSKTKYSDWEFWLKQTYLPMLKSQVAGAEVGNYEVMSAEEGEERTISVQWKVATPNELDIINKQSPLILNHMSSEFGQDVLFFSTILKAL